MQNLSDAVWDFADGAGCWDMNEKLDVTEENGELKLVTLGIDSHLFNYFDRFDASKYSQLQITYRASGFPKNRTTGGLFYMEKGDKNFTAKKFVRFPSLICDGNEHTLTVKVALKDIIALRLDIVDQTPGTVWLKKIAFLP